MESNIYVVKLHHVKQISKPNGDQFVFLVMDYVPHDLSKFLKNRPKNFDENHALTLIYNLLSAIQFIHSVGILHRDIKPDNILFTSDCKIKLCDLGLARTFD